tara:strand:+ start:8145 stop:9812 length:1668 start_codon:yes stop_codon:yes gene_type:complete
MARRIILQEPDSGLDVFLKELSKYASPQYQLALKDQNRADARLELSKRQIDENERRYQNSLTQQKFRNDRAIATENIAKEKFKIEKSDSDFATAKQYINESFSGMNAQEIANMNIDSLLIDDADPRAKSRARQYANNIQKSGRRQLQTITSRMNLYNQGKDADSQISKAEALDLFGDDNTYNEFLVNNYLKQGSLNDEQKYLINSNTTRLTALRKNESDLLTQQASGMDVTDALARNTIVIQNLQGEIDGILKPSGDDSTRTNIDAYGKTSRTITNPLDNNPILSPLRPEDTFASNDMYNVLFSDDEDIAESAISMANRNASGEDVGDVVIEDGKVIESLPAMELEEGITEKELKDMLAKAKKEGTEEEIGFLERQISGLSTAQTGTGGEQAPPPSEDLDLFSNQEQRKRSQAKKKKARSKFLPTIDFTNRLKRIDLFESKLQETPIKNKKKQNKLNAKINKIKKSIVKDFSKIYDSSEGAMSIPKKYTERTPVGTSMSRNELARLISIYNEGQDSLPEVENPNSFKNTMSRGASNMLEGLGTTLDLLQFKNPYR